MLRPVFGEVLSGFAFFFGKILRRLVHRLRIHTKAEGFVEVEMIGNDDCHKEYYAGNSTVISGI